MKMLKYALLALVGTVAVTSAPSSANAQPFDPYWRAAQREEVARHEHWRHREWERRQQAERAQHWRWCHSHPGRCY